MSRTVVNFTGRATAGAVSVPGVRAGDEIIAVFKVADFSSGAASFIGFVLADNEIQQLQNDDLSSVAYSAVVER